MKVGLASLCFLLLPTIGYAADCDRTFGLDELIVTQQPNLDRFSDFEVTRNLRANISFLCRIDGDGRFNDCRITEKGGEDYAPDAVFLDWAQGHAVALTDKAGKPVQGQCVAINLKLQYE